jgi:hypothetical protein
MLPVSLNCPLLIASSVFCNVYSNVFLVITTLQETGFLTVSTIFLLDFGIVPTVWYFLIFQFITLIFERLTGKPSV